MGYRDEYLRFYKRHKVLQAIVAAAYWEPDLTYAEFKYHFLDSQDVLLDFTWSEADLLDKDDLVSMRFSFYLLTHKICICASRTPSKPS